MKIFEVFREIVKSIGNIVIFITTMLSKKIKKTISKISSSIKAIGKVKKRDKKTVDKRVEKRVKNKKVENAPNRFFSKLKAIKLFMFGILFSCFFILLPLEISAWFKELPSPDLLKIDSSRRNTKILDRNGKVLYEIYIDQSFDPVKLEQVPKCVKDATIAVEDAEFYSHKGLNIRGIVRAAKETLFKGNMQGGSTITQQLVKNVLLSPERTISRKIKEAVLSILVETKYSKDEILEMYLNNTPYGGTAWGVQSAAKKFFGKNVWELNLAECSLLAGLPSSPTTNSPTSNLEAAKARQKHVLEKMVSLGMITSEESQSAQGEALNLVEQMEYIKAPHFVNFVRNELERLYGKRAVELGGMTVVTTLDLDLQEKIQKIVADEIENNGWRYGFSNGAAVVLDSQSGGILAYVGSIDYFKEGWGSFDVATAYRQPGSSVKPITYSLALAGSYTLASVIEDSAISFPQINQKAYTPVNYDGQYHGKVTLRQALANSYNIPAVKLASSVGPDNIVSLGREMGLTNWAIGDGYGLSVTLGGKEVRLLDLSNVFATFSRKGVYKNVDPFISLKDGRGYEMRQADVNGKRVISEEVSYLIWSVLSDNNARTPAFGSNSYLVVPKHTVAVKTGTTDNKKDNWTVGFTPSYVVGVWVGNNDNKPMNAYLASGLSGAAPIWNKIFTTVLEGKTNEVLEKPDGIFTRIDSECGRQEIFIKGSYDPNKSLCSSDSEDKKSKDKKTKH